MVTLASMMLSWPCPFGASVAGMERSAIRDRAGIFDPGFRRRSIRATGHGDVARSGPALRSRVRGRHHARDLGRGLHVPVPALGERRRDIELVKHARDDVIDD